MIDDFVLLRFLHAALTVIVQGYFLGYLPMENQLVQMQVGMGVSKLFALRKTFIGF